MAHTRTSNILSIAVLLSGLSSVASSQIIHEAFKLVPADAEAMDQFGNSVAVDGDTVVIGSLFGGVGTGDSGSAYIYDATSGVLRTELNPAGAQSNFNVGFDVAVRGSEVLVGAPRSDLLGQLSGALYEFNATTGAQVGAMFPFRIILPGNPVGTAFGWSVDLGDQYLVVGGPGDIEGSNFSGGSAFLYNADDRTVIAKFFPNDVGPVDNFGRAVASSGPLVVVSSSFGDIRGEDSGVIYVFDGATATQLLQIAPRDGAAGDLFGESLDFDASTIVVGAAFADTNGTDSGAAYLFDANTGQQLHKLVSDDLQPGDQFGTSVAISGDLVVVGARLDDDQGDGSGAAFVFDRVSGAQLAKLLPSDGQAEDVFGISIAIDDTTVVVGASGDDDAGNFAGSAYIFDIASLVCPADLTGDGVLDFFDVSAFLNAYNAMESAADFDNNGVFDFFDVSAFLNAFNAGCP